MTIDVQDTVSVYDSNGGHDGPGWYYVFDEYHDEGSVGAFASREEAVRHATEAGFAVSNPTPPAENSGERS